MKKHSVNYLIALELVRAQTGSDSGKGIHELKDHKVRQDAHLGYRFKVKHILNALRLASSNRSAFLFWTEDRPDHGAYITYFLYREKVDGKISRYQISFHTPYGLEDELTPWVGKGTKMRWDKNLGGSRLTAQHLLDLINAKEL